ncbi:MAG TPA: CerR family C-terminal domain-containing protein [Reyranella sp.]|nr:CerR family C-terminal domain-containing protein [Reyranella sp.]
MNESSLRHRQGSYTRGEDTRRRILDAALEIFAAEGYEGASTRVLAERAGVNLPAIQYYFGNKEGLYRAVIESIIRHNEAHMAPLTAKVKVALADPATPRETLLDLLCEIFESFVTLVSGGHQVESRRLLYARAEVERTPGLEMLHESGIREIFEPCLTLVARLLGKPAEDPEVVVRTLALFGQVTIFCNKAVRRVLKMPEFDDERAATIRAIIRSHTQAVVRDIARSSK